MLLNSNNPIVAERHEPPFCGLHEFRFHLQTECYPNATGVASTFLQDSGIPCLLWSLGNSENTKAQIKRKGIVDFIQQKLLHQHKVSKK